VCSNTIPKGTYKAQITEIKFKTSSSSETSYDMEVSYTIAEGAFAKRVVKDFMSEKAFSFRLKPFLTAIAADLNREFDSVRELYEYGIATAKGKFVMVEIGTRTYNGNEYNNIVTWAPLPGSSTSVDDVLNEFKSSPELTPDKPTISDIPSFGADEAEPVAEVSDDDMPF
jgi:hypothetical protein